METKHITAAYSYTSRQQEQGIFNRLFSRYLAYADGQAPNRMLWFFMALMVNGVFFLAAPAILIWYFGAPIAVLAIMVLNFFANLIANMGGAGIRTTLSLFYLGLIVNLGCILFSIL